MHGYAGDGLPVLTTEPANEKTKQTTMRRKVKMAAAATKIEQAIDLDEFRVRFTACLDQVKATFIDRDDATRALALAALTRNNVLFVGTPGTGKTALIQCFLKHMTGATYFEELCGSFTTLDQVVGPTNIKEFQLGKWTRNTKGMLPDADVVFLDEVMKSNDGTINSLLGILNERKFKVDGSKAVDIPLLFLAAATNWPEIDARTENVGALYDRFVIRLAIDDIDPDDCEKTADMLETEELDEYRPGVTFSKAELIAAQVAVRRIPIERPVRVKLAEVRKRLKGEGIYISARRLKKMQLVLRAQAWLMGRDHVTVEHFDVLAYGLWIDRPHIQPLNAIIDTIDQATVQKCVRVIDEQRRKFKQLQDARKDVRVRRAPQLIEEITKAAKKVQAVLEEEGATERGRSKIRDEIQKLRDDYKKLKALTKDDMGLNLKGDS